jgi:EAL domain-containing protein (putative c-di-GMP-specific phosphodiesterase class I)
VIAEGVETKEQADLLRNLGCAVGQGFHYCIPAPWAEIRATLGTAALDAPDGSRREAS